MDKEKLKTSYELESDYDYELWRLEKGIITKEEFSDICMDFLIRIMIENRAILERLKNI